MDWPRFLQKTTFKGKCFMTHATKAIYRWLLSDFIKVSNIATEQMLYSEQDLETSMEKIETINFHEEKEVNGIKFWAYNAGHVLGAAMFMIEVGTCHGWAELCQVPTGTDRTVGGLD